MDGARDYRLMTRQFVNSLLEIKEYNRFSKGLFGWVGFKTKWLEFENVERVAGETKWSFWKLFLYSIGWNCCIFFVSLIYCYVYWACILRCCIYSYYFCDHSLFCLVILRRAGRLWCGIILNGWRNQLFCTGLLKTYLAKTHMEVKKRPIFICKETNSRIEEEGPT